MKPIRAMAVSGMLGYGFTEEAFRRRLSLGLDLIACDAGSADPGPYYLGSGSAFVSRLAVNHDLGLVVTGGMEAGVPVFIGPAGGSGSLESIAQTTNSPTAQYLANSPIRAFGSPIGNGTDASPGQGSPSR